MTFHGPRLQGHLIVAVEEGPSVERPGVRITVCTPSGIQAIALDENHVEAVEYALRAARLELQARAVSL